MLLRLHTFAWRAQKRTICIMFLRVFNHSTTSHLPLFPSPSLFLTNTPHLPEAYGYICMQAIYTSLCGPKNEGQHIKILLLSQHHPTSPPLPFCISLERYTLSECNLKTREPPPLCLPHTLLPSALSSQLAFFSSSSSRSSSIYLQGALEMWLLLSLSRV